MVYYNIETAKDLEKAYGVLLAAGTGREKANEAVKVLSNWNSGYIYTDLENKSTIILISHAQSFEELFNTINHEIDHAKAHLCEYFNIPQNSEKSAYLQGEISKQMYKGVALSICPKCNCGEKVSHT